MKYRKALFFVVTVMLCLGTAVLSFGTSAVDEAEAQRTHFTDMCTHHTLDTTDYSVLEDTEKAAVHAALAELDYTQYSKKAVQKYVDAAVIMKGNFTTALFDITATLDGYAIRLHGDGAARAVFSLRNADIRVLENAGLKVEYGSVLTAAGKTPALTYDAVSDTFVAGNEDTEVYAAYRGKSRLVSFLPSKVGISTFAHPILYSQEDALLNAKKEMVWQSYIAVFDGTNGYAYINDTQSSRFGDSVTLQELYDFGMLNGYEEAPAVQAMVDRLMMTVNAAVEAEIAAVETALTAAKNCLQERNELLLIAADYLAQTSVGSDKLAHYNTAYTADFAYGVACRRDAMGVQALSDMSGAMEALSLAVAAAVADYDAAADADYYVNAVVAPYSQEYTVVNEAMGQRDATLGESIATACTDAKTALGVSGGTVSLNGTALSEYLVFGDGEERAVNLLIDTLRTEKNTALPLLPLSLAPYAEAEKVIVLGDRTGSEYGVSVLETNAKGHVYAYGSEQNGVYHAVLKLLQMVDASDTVTINERMTIKVSDVLTQTYAVDSFFNADGSLNTASDEPLTIVCLGGSLTELGQEWVDMVGDYFARKFPNRQVTIHNAGVGGTESIFGLTRFAEHVLSYDPDLVFIEFAFNDLWYDRVGAQKYIESMLQQCLQQEKIPGVIFGYMPPSVDKTSDHYTTWSNQVMWKEELARHYGISGVNIYDYFYRCYENEKMLAGDADMTYEDFLADIYPLLNGSANFCDKYDVHPLKTGRGYKLYGQAFLEAFDANLAGMLTRLKYTDILCQGQESWLGSSYNFIAHDDPCLSYTGDWETWTADQKYNNADSQAALGTGRYQYPFFADGIRRAYKQSGASITFQTTADSIFIYYHGQAAGSTVKVYVGDSATPVGTYSTKGAQQPFQSRTEFKLNNASNSLVTVRIVVDEPTDDLYSFAFGYIIEKFEDK